jgi:hypothetical protein
MSQETPLSNFCDSMSRQCDQSYKDCEESIRQSPIPSVLAAAGIGYFLCLLPLGLILRAVLKIALSLVKPALLVFAILKIAERCPCAKSTPLAEREPLLDSPAGPAPETNS